MRELEAQIVTPVQAWHWVSDERVLHDGARVEAGAIYRLPQHARPLPRHRDSHGCVRALDALRYAPGTVVCLVELAGVVVHDPDDHATLAASQQRVLWVADARRALTEFTCEVAETEIAVKRALGREIHPPSWEVAVAKHRRADGSVEDDPATRGEGVARWAKSRADAAARDLTEELVGWLNADAQTEEWQTAWDAANQAALAWFNMCLEAKLWALSRSSGSAVARDA